MSSRFSIPNAKIETPAIRYADAVAGIGSRGTMPYATPGPWYSV